MAMDLVLIKSSLKQTPYCIHRILRTVYGVALLTLAFHYQIILSYWFGYKEYVLVCTNVENWWEIILIAIC